MQIHEKEFVFKTLEGPRRAIQSHKLENSEKWVNSVSKKETHPTGCAERDDWTFERERKWVGGWGYQRL